MIERVFEPLLENNITQLEASDSDEEEEQVVNYDPKNGKYVDGGKLNPKTQREI